MSLPSYAASSLPGSTGSESDNEVSRPPALLNLVPSAAHFLHGYLGYSPASIRGSLQLKFPGATSYRSSINRVSVLFTGIERVGSSESDNAIELVREERTIWSRSTADEGTSDGSANADSGKGPPGNIDFDIALTDDLPVCTHVGSGSLEYELQATLHTSRKKTLSITTPVHLARTSPPLDLQITTALHNEAQVYTCQHPTTAHIYFPHGTRSFRRSESIELRVRVPPPEAVLVQEKGLKLRSISAELHRTVSLRETGAGEDDDEIRPIQEAPILDTLISHSGKAAAFSSSRSIFLNIWLQPVPAEFCEAITQSTIFLDIGFSVRVIASFQGRAGDREEVVILDKPVTIIPDYPPASASDLDMPASGRALQLSDFGSSQPVAGTSNNAPQKRDEELLRAFEEETEYDGYEELSQGADLENAPPSIDADQPPPALEVASRGAPFLFCTLSAG